jgi:hypothetical protein
MVRGLPDSQAVLIAKCCNQLEPLEKLRLDALVHPAILVEPFTGSVEAPVTNANLREDVS